jgi:hypothetical protein
MMRCERWTEACVCPTYCLEYVLLRLRLWSSCSICLLKYIQLHAQVDCKQCTEPCICMLAYCCALPCNLARHENLRLHAVCGHCWMWQSVCIWAASTRILSLDTILQKYTRYYTSEVYYSVQVLSVSFCVCSSTSCRNVAAVLICTPESVDD